MCKNQPFTQIARAEILLYKPNLYFPLATSEKTEDGPIVTAVTPTSPAVTPTSQSCLAYKLYM